MKALILDGSLRGDEATVAVGDLLSDTFAELLVLAFPLYVDGVPAPLVAVLEWVAARGLQVDRAVRVAALVNCGFPEAVQCTPALSVTRRFAEETGMSWVGGLALGAGAAIDGRALDGVGDLARSMRLALDLAAEALAEGRPVTREAVKTMATPMMPARVYRLVGDRGFRSRAKAQGTESRLADQPYEPCLGAEPTWKRTFRRAGGGRGAA